MLSRAEVPGCISSFRSQINRNTQTHTSIWLPITIRIVDSKFWSNIESRRWSTREFPEIFAILTGQKIFWIRSPRNKFGGFKYFCFFFNCDLLSKIAGLLKTFESKEQTSDSRDYKKHGKMRNTHPTCEIPNKICRWSL